MFRDEDVPLDSENYGGDVQSDNDSRSDKGLKDEPQVKVSTEAGNAKVTVDLPSVNKQDLRIHCAEDAVSLSIRTTKVSWAKEVLLPFRVDPDTAKAVFRNEKLELIVRRHGPFNPPKPRLDWV